MNYEKLMPIQDFVDKGYLQELNRQFLHPLGLSLQVYVDKNGKYSFANGVLDKRDDLSGIHFDYKNSDQKRIDVALKKAEFVGEEFDKRMADRETSLGYIIEPIKGK